MKLMIINSPIGSALTSGPDVTIVTDSSITTHKNPLFVPDANAEYVFELAPAVKIFRLGKSIPVKFASRYYDAITLIARVMPVIDGKPVRNGSAIYTAYDSAIVRGEWIEDFTKQTLEVTLGEQKMEINIADLRIDETISMLSKYFSMKIGDIVSPCYLPLSTTPVIDTRITASLSGCDVINIKVK